MLVADVTEIESETLRRACIQTMFVNAPFPY